MRLRVAKVLPLYFAIAFAHALDIPPAHSQCIAQCEVTIGGNSTLVTECSNQLVSLCLPPATILNIRFRLTECICDPNSPTRKAFVSCVNQQCSSDDAQAVPAMLDGICENSTSGNFFHIVKNSIFCFSNSLLLSF
jgi:hypothetical protein